MTKRPKKTSALPVLVVATIGTCVVLLAVARAVVHADSNETWSGWVQAIGSIAAIAAGVIVVAWEQERQSEREEAQRRQAATILGWRIYTDVIGLSEELKLHIKFLLKERKKRRGSPAVHIDFQAVEISATLSQNWTGFHQFEGKIGPALAQTISILETYNTLSESSRTYPMAFVEDQIRALVSYRRVVIGALDQLTDFLGRDLPPAAIPPTRVIRSVRDRA